MTLSWSSSATVAHYSIERLSFASIAIALAVVGCATAPPQRDAARVERGGIAPLVVVEAPTPPLNVPRYDTSGVFPQVRSADGTDLRTANAALQDAILDDQRGYAVSARRYSRVAAPRYRGRYTTAIDRRLISASTVVVSVLLPHTALYPGGSDAKGWIATTVLVSSGKSVALTDLFANPPRGLAVLAKAWKAQVARTPNAPCLRAYASLFAPKVRNYRLFALTPSGLAVGVWEVGPCSGLLAIVPYRVLRAHWSPTGRRLIAAVRTPRWAR